MHDVQRSSDAMVEQLQTVLDRVIDWLKYEEAKNVALLTLDGVGLSLVWPNVSSAPTPLVVLVVAGFMFSLLVVLASVYPVLLGGRIHDYLKRKHDDRKRADPAWQPNVVFVADIAGYDVSTYLSDFRTAVHEDADDKPFDRKSLEFAYANEIITNSEITVVKLGLFKIGFCLTVFALVTAAVSALFR